VSKIYDALKRAEQEREFARGSSRRVVSTDGESPSSPDEQEDYSRLRASLRFAPAAAHLRTILLTASSHGEGTTRTALGLAMALAAEPGSRVLLVEANLRSPSLAKRLSLNAGPGLREYLAGQARAEDLVTRVEDQNFSVVLAGGRSIEVQCEGIMTAVERLQPQFDFIILDAPPVNRFVDTSLLAPKMDSVILVVEADRTLVVDAERAKRSLERVGAHLFGVVLNRQRSYVPAALQALL